MYFDGRALMDAKHTKYLAKRFFSGASYLNYSTFEIIKFYSRSSKLARHDAADLRFEVYGSSHIHSNGIFALPNLNRSTTPNNEPHIARSLYISIN